MKKLNKALTRIKTIYLFTTLILIAISFYVFSQVKSLVDSSNWVNHTNQVSLSLQNVANAITEAESNQRGYLLTGDVLLLNKMKQLQYKVATEIITLENLTKDNAGQKTNINLLKKSIEEKQVCMQKTLVTYIKFESSNEFQKNLKVGIAKMNDVKKHIKAIGLTENAILKLRKQNYSHLSFITPLFIFVLFFGSLLILLASYLRINNSLKVSHKLRENLIAEKSLAQTILDLTTDSIFVMDKELRYLTVNHKAKEVLNGLSNDYIGNKISDLFPESNAIEDMKKALNGEIIHLQDFHSTVTNIHYERTYSPLKIGNEVMGVVIHSRDISDILKINKQLEQQNENYEYAEQVGLFGSYQYNFNEKKIRYSDNLYRLLGCEPQEFPACAENFHKFIHPEDIDHYIKSTNEALNDRKISKWEYRIIRKDVKTINIRGTRKFITDNNNVEWMIGTLQDITEEKLKENFVKESEETFNKLFQFSPFGITLSVKSSGKIIDINDNYIKMVGYSREELIGKTSQELNLVNDEERAKIYKELKEKGSVKNFEVTIRKKSGKTIPVLISIESVRIKGKKFYINAINDITLRKKAEEEIYIKNKELENMNKELQSFAYISSHDLQEPLRKIQTFASRILEKEYGILSEAGKDNFSRIQVAANRMQVLIQDLLAFSRTNSTERIFEETDLHQVVEDVKEVFKDELIQKNAIIESIGFCNARVIRFQFYQLLYNLISNALKFSHNDRPPYIKLTCDIIKPAEVNHINLLPNKEYYHIIIIDNGIGFDHQYREKIFEVFQRLHGKMEYTGTGIGLAIVKKIIDNHEGFITATGEPNKGTRFDIFIPLE